MATHTHPFSLSHGGSQPAENTHPFYRRLKPLPPADLNNRLTDLDIAVNASDSITYDYTHDKVGHRKTMTVDSSDLYSYDYDKIYQLADANSPGSEDDLAFNYDLLGNRTNMITNNGTTAYVSNSLNQYTVIGEPIAHWCLNDNAASSTVIDATGNGHDGIMYRDTATLNTDVVSVTGKFSNGFILDDPNKEYVNCGTSLDITDFGGQDNGVVTITAWVKPGDTSKYNYITRYIGGVYYLSAGGTGAYSGKVKAMYRHVGSVNGWATSTATINANEWTHIAFTLEAGVGYKIYINGVLDCVHADPDAILYDYSSTKYIGHGYDANCFFGGTIDNVAAYDRALSDAEVSALYTTSQEAVYQISYDDNGNITADQRGNTYTYNWQNKLITATTADCTVTYTYDALGRRSAKEVDDGQTTETTEYCYNSQQVIAEFNGAGTQVRKYLYGPGIDEPIAMIDVDGQTETAYYYHFDGLGSVVALSDDNGTIVEGYTYDVFGNCIINTSAGTDGNWLTPDGTTAATSAYGNPYLYTGRRWEAETGLYYYRFRYYDPAAGRFISADPIGYGDGMNMYAYCGNNAINRIDPMGLMWSFYRWFYTDDGYASDAAYNGALGTFVNATPNAVVLGGSVTGGAGYGVTAGVERVWSPFYGFNDYMMLGHGPMTPDIGITGQVGLVWNFTPENYTGDFYDLQMSSWFISGSCFKGPEEGSPKGFKIGPAYSVAPASIGGFHENYISLDDKTTGGQPSNWDVPKTYQGILDDLRGFPGGTGFGLDYYLPPGFGGGGGPLPSPAW